MINKRYIKILIIALISVGVFQGCLWRGPVKTVLKKESSQFAQPSKVVNASRLAEGGRIAFLLFNAGPGVEAGHEADKAALMFIKGLGNVLREEGRLFEILTGEEARNADIIISGHITKMQETSKIKRFIFRENKVSLGITAKLIDRKAGEVILYFSDELVSESRRENYFVLGEKIGQDMGRFILSGETQREQ